MPGYGISEAATTLVGQSLGANRIRLLKRFANITVWSGMLIMGVMGVLMYVAAPQIIGVMTPVEEIRMLGNRDSADRSFCGADVCGIYRRLRCICGCGQYICSQSDEFWQYLGCPADTGSMACPYDGATGRMACHVY